MRRNNAADSIPHVRNMQEPRRETKRGRGRPPRSSSETAESRELIVREARRQFGEVGYRATTLRSVGRAAGVDPRLVLHYFGSKRELFAASVELPVQPEFIIEHVFAGGREGVAERAVGLIL